MRLGWLFQGVTISNCQVRDDAWLMVVVINDCPPQVGFDLNTGGLTQDTQVCTSTKSWNENIHQTVPS